MKYELLQYDRGPGASVKREDGKVVGHFDDGLDAFFWLQSKYKRIPKARRYEGAFPSAPFSRLEVPNVAWYGDAHWFVLWRVEVWDGVD